MVQVHFHAVDDVGKLAFGQPENGLDGAQGLVDGMLGRGVGLEDFGQILSPPCERGAGNARVAVFVCNVVQLAAIGVKDGDGIALRGGEEAEAGEEVGMAGLGFFAAVV